MKNYCYRLILTIILLTPLGLLAFGQSGKRISTDDAFIAMGKLFESNQILVNGIFFVDKYRNDIGCPFLNSPYFSEGIFTFNNTVYTECKLAYNLVDQKIVVVEKRDIKTEKPFIPPVEFVSRFEIENKVFIKDLEENKFYCQVFESEQFSVLAYLHKRVTKSYHLKNILAYKYSDILKDIFVVIGNRKIGISGKRDYLALFPPDIKKDLSGYIKKNTISFKKSDLAELKELFIYTREVVEKNKINLGLNKTQVQ